MNRGFSFEPPIDISCGECGFPLPRILLHRVVRDDSDPAVVASLMDGNINRSDCRNCGVPGWVDIPLLWIDRVRKRAVYFAADRTRHDLREDSLRELLELAMHDIAGVDRETVLRRLQRVNSPLKIRDALARSAEGAEADRLGYEAFLRREILPPRDRLQRVLDDAIEIGDLYADGREVSTEFLALANEALANVAEDDISPRAVILRKLIANLEARIPKHDPLSLPSVPEVSRPPESDATTPQHTASILDGDSPPIPIVRPRSEKEEPIDFAQFAARANAKDITPSERVDVLRKLSHAYINANLNDEGYAAARQMIEAASAASDAHAHAEAFVLAGVAAVRLGDPDAALSYLTVAQKENQQLPNPDLSVLALENETAGDAFMLERNFPRARDEYALVLQLYERAGPPEMKRRLLNKLAGACMWTGALADAAAAYRRVADEAPQDSVEKLSAQLNLAHMLAHIGPPPQHLVKFPYTATAQERSDGQADLTLNAPLPPDPPLPRGLRYRVEATLQPWEGPAVILFESVVNDEAVDLMIQVRRDAVRLGMHDVELGAYDFLANAYLEYEMQIAARDILQLSIKRHEELGLTVRAQTYFTLAALWERMAQDLWSTGQTDASRNGWSEALALYEQTIRADADDRWGTNREEMLSRSLRGRAFCLEALGRHVEAREAYRQATARFEGVRQFLVAREQKMHAQSRAMILFPFAQRNALTLFAQTGDLAMLKEAFSFAEAGRSRILLDYLGVEGVSVARPVTVEEVAAALPNGTALVQYSTMEKYGPCVGSWAIYVVLPQSGLAPIVVQRDLDEVRQARNDFYAQVDAHKGNLAEHAAFDIALEKLGSLLLPSELIELFRQHGTRRMLFAPEDYLFDVPFAALRVRWNGAIDDLCRSGIETIVVPSASAYIAASKQIPETTGGGLLLCMSDPQGNLPGVSEWVEEQIRSKWPGPSEHLANEAATRTAVIDALRRSRNAFYFGHGIYRADDAAGSGLVLHDQRLTMRDLMATSFRLDCDLFLALACFGARVASDSESRELLGFSAALLQAGARNVIGGVWPLLVGFAKSFGRTLMDYLADGVPAADAYRRALIDTRKADPRWNHPYAWSGVRLIGTGV